MVSDEKLILSFIEECRSNLLLNDECQKNSEELFTKLYEIKQTINEEEFSLLEDLISKVISSTKKTYFQYGQCYSGVLEKRISSIKEE